MFNELLLLWSSQPGVSLAIWLVISIIILYLARQPAHLALLACGRSVYRVMRLGSSALATMERQLHQRNKDVILAHGQETIEKAIEREFARINDLVARDLSHYPALHRELSDAVGKLEADYQAATDAPPMPPEWLSVVESLSELPKNGDPLVANILENIKEEITTSHEQTLKAYQKSSAERHRLLAAMQPQWRTLNAKLSNTKDTVAITQERADTIDKHMANYQAMRDQDDLAARSLTASSLTQFFIAGMVLCIAVMGGLINFQLIALPMSEMVGGNSQIGNIKTSDIAALVIILIEIAMGLFLLESLRITHMFPVIGHMDDRLRKRMILITFSILFILASIEASLAYMRDLLALDREALQQSLAGVANTNAEFRWIPSVGQMIMGFILPFALAFVAIPLESFIHASRTVIGALTITILRVLAVALRLIGGLANQLSKLLVHAYDILITVPLAIENWVSASRNRRSVYEAENNTESDAIDFDLDSGSDTETPKAKPKTRAKKSAPESLLTQ